jgi:predicted ATP-dependent serine protease
MTISKKSSVTEFLSDCCDAPPANNVQYSFGKIIGVCSACMQWAEFTAEKINNNNKEKGMNYVQNTKKTRNL